MLVLQKCLNVLTRSGQGIGGNFNGVDIIVIIKLPMTLKYLVIIDHYLWYFKEMGTNFHDTYEEYVEAHHYSLDRVEENKKINVKRKLVTDGHLK